MNAAAAIAVAVDILSGIIGLTIQLQKVSQMIQDAQAQGRDLTAEELDQLRQMRLDARQQAIDA